MINAVIVLADTSFALVALAPMEILQSAGTLWPVLNGEAPSPRFRVRIASSDGQAARTPYAFGLEAECGLTDIEAADIIIVPGGGAAHAILPWLRHWHGRGACVAGLCTGVSLLADSGLLNGRQATAHWSIIDSLRQRHPQICWRPEYAITEDGQMFCGTGVHAAIDLSLYLVEKFCGRELALQCARALLLKMPNHLQPGHALRPLSRPHSDPQIRETEEYLRQNMHRDISADFLAERIDMGARSFIRRFKAATGHAPGAYMQLLRMAAAKELLENDTGPISLISSRIGYSDQAFFRRLFKRHTGLTPSAYREQFGKMGSGGGMSR